MSPGYSLKPLKESINKLLPVIGSTFLINNVPESTEIGSLNLITRLLPSALNFLEITLAIVNSNQSFK